MGKNKLLKKKKNTMKKINKKILLKLKIEKKKNNLSCKIKK